MSKVNDAVSPAVKPQYTVAIYEGPAPVNASLIVTSTATLAVLGATEACLEAARLETLGQPGSQPVINLLSGVRSTLVRGREELERYGIMC